MEAIIEPPRPTLRPTSERYARCNEAARRIRWEIERDVIRGRPFDAGRHCLPDALSKIGQLTTLQPAEALRLSQIQGRSYAGMLGALERHIGAQIVGLGHGHALSDAVACDALLHWAEDEIKHRELFRRLDAMAAGATPDGYRFLPEATEVAAMVLRKSTWAVLGLNLHVEMLALAHYRASLEPGANLAPLWQDVLRHHWQEATQHAVLAELEWRRVDALAGEAERERGVADLIALVAAVDGLLQLQAEADAGCFLASLRRSHPPQERAAVHDVVLKAYRWQFIAAGVHELRLREVLKALTTTAQQQRLHAALAPVLAHAGS